MKKYCISGYILLLITCIFVVSLLLTGCGREKDETEISVPFVQTTVGDRLNRLHEERVASPAWGENIVKIASYEDTLFTYAMDLSVEPWQTTLYSREGEDIWREGETISVGNPPNLFVDSQGFVHLIGTDADRSVEVRIFHIRFDQPNTVSSPYTFEYITPECKTLNRPWEAVRGSGLYNGAAIGEDDTILVAYQASADSQHAILARIYDPVTKEWSFETVTTNLSTRFCYPYAAVSDRYFHVLAIEDEYDEELASAGYPPFRYGSVKHFQRARDSDQWIETTLIDFNQTLSNLEIAEIGLRNLGLVTDSAERVHVLISYGAEAEGEPRSVQTHKPRAFHYWKDESAAEWHLEPDIEMSWGWMRLWEREDGQLFYVHAKINEQLYLTPVGATEKYVISDLASRYLDSPVPFITTRRSGSQPGSILNVALLPMHVETETVVISVDTSDIRVGD